MVTEFKFNVLTLSMMGFIFNPELIAFTKDIILKKILLPLKYDKSEGKTLCLILFFSFLNIINRYDVKM